MIDIQFSPSGRMVANREHEILQEYVRALLARQQALDLLETIQQQIKQVWAVMRKLLEGTGSAARAAQAVRAARAAQATQAQNSYRSLEKRREECIAALHQAERRANAALQTMLVAQPQPAFRKTPNFTMLSRARFNEHPVCRPAGRKPKNAFSGNC
jgi:hypothetical protein